MKKFNKIIISLMIFLLFTSSIIKSQNLDSIKMKKEIHILLISMNSDTISLEFKNKYTIICLFSIFCSPCIKELNSIEKIYKKWNTEFNTNVIAISSFSEKEYLEKTIKFVERKSYTFPVYNDYKNSFAEYCYNSGDLPKENSYMFFQGKVELLKPQILIINSAGKIVFQKRGFMDGDEEKMETFLKSN